jgi:hypothetical protein
MIKKNLLAISVFFVINFNIYGQNIECYLGMGIDTTNNIDNKNIFNLWKNYLSSNPDSLYDNPYWNKKEKENYKSYDLLKSEGWLSPSLYGLKPKNTVLSIKNNGDYYIIKSIFYWVYPKTLHTSTLAITNVIAKKQKGEYKLFNYLPYHTQTWNRRKIGIIEYIYHPMHPFNNYKAQKANDLIDKLIRTFNIKVDKVEYYIALNCDEIYKLKGFDFVIGMGKEPNLCGFYDRFNNIIYSNSQEGEYYEHEIIHLINNFFPKAHGLFLNGLSAYIGSKAHLGQSLDFHIKRMNLYLNIHPEIDLTNFSNFYQMDDQTTPSYILGAIICHLTLEKGGIELLKKALNSGNSDDDLYRFIKKELNIEQKNLNKFMRKKIAEYSKNGFTAIEF